MIVLDASALGDWLLATPDLGARVAAQVRADGDLHTLDFAWVEIASVLRRKHLAGELDATRAVEVLDDLDDVPLTTHLVAPLVSRIWELRGGLTAYDGAYVALAEALGCTLVTTDAGMAGSHGHRATITLIARD